jgi:hypothetical protein
MSINQNTLNDIHTLGGNTDALNNLTNGLNSVYASLTNLKDIQDNALARQNDIKYLVEYESDRLNNKKMVIDKAIDTQNRIIYFNDNSRKIYAAYLKILITVVIILAIVWFFLTLASYLKNDFIPEWVINIIIIIVVATGLIYIYKCYIEIRRRNRYNFDELNLEPPPIKSDVDKKASSGSNLLDDMKSCEGAECCAPATVGNPGSRWNELTGKCEYEEALPANVNNNETFSNYTSSHLPLHVVDNMNAQLYKSNKTTPNESFEFANYSAYN